MNDDFKEKYKFFLEIKDRLDPEDKSEHQSIKFKFFIGLLCSVAILPSTVKLSEAISSHAKLMNKGTLTIFLNLGPALFISNTLLNSYMKPFIMRIHEKYSITEQSFELDLKTLEESDLFKD